jgi:chromosome segregation ATPase
MYASILRQLPEDMRLTMLELAETIEQNVRAELAVRREDFESLSGVMRETAERTYHVEQRLDGLEAALTRLAEAQARTEERVEELAAAQKRTEAQVEELAAAQKRTEAQVEELAAAQKRTEARVEELAQAQVRTEERVGRLETAVAELAAAQKRTEARVEELAAAQARTEETLQALIERVDKIDQRLSRVEIKVGDLRGDQLHRTYRERAHGRFGAILRRVRVVEFQEIEPQLEERLPEEDVDDLRLLDLIVRGEQKGLSERAELWLAVEVSAVIDRGDVERAARRAASLRRAGYRAAAAVAGEERTEGAAQTAYAAGVAMVQNGAVLYIDEALRVVGLN